jgi:hypothetical protein
MVWCVPRCCARLLCWVLVNTNAVIWLRGRRGEEEWWWCCLGKRLNGCGEGWSGVLGQCGVLVSALRDG